MTLDRMDKRILKALQKDGRIGNAELAKKLGMSATACWNHTKRLMDEGYVKEVRAILDPEKLGLPVLVTVGVVLDRSTPDSFTDFEAAARGISGCLECHLVAGEFDYFLMLRIRDLERFNKLHAGEIIKLPGVRQIRTFFVLKEILSTTELPV